MGRRCADRLSRIRDRERRAAWRGRIRIVNGTVHRFGSNGFEHVEESEWRSDVIDVEFPTKQGTRHTG
ncbi:hypothetical protein [Burkholderia sp. 22313]|uniref:hypothetical protein n=1 Tax=Burkholderia sp. 22313 TaxID=3453908 RepID=UPI002D1DD527|nr:hypothetical protein [Burkholderia sp.]